MDEKFCIFYKSLLVSDVCPNCQKNQPSSLVEEIIAIYFLQGYQYKIIFKVFGKASQDKNVTANVKNKIEAAKTQSPQFDERNNCSAIRHGRFARIIGTE